MDALARDGIRFEQAYCTNPVCAPSRTSLATGMMPCRLGADTNKHALRLSTLPAVIKDNSPGKLMKRAGYDTFYGGKVHMCQALHPEHGGYDEYVSDDGDALPAACTAFMKRERKAPCFAVASFVDPHNICYAHRARSGIDSNNVLGLYKDARMLPATQLPPLPDNYAIAENEPTAVRTNLNPEAVTPAIRMRDEYGERDWQIARWIYHRLTENVDRQIGALLDGLAEAGLEDSTLIIFTSDHGNVDASHRLTSKGLFYEQAVGVPFIMKYPAGIAPNQVDKRHLVSTGLDLIPTLCDYAGIQKPDHMLGHSLRPLAESVQDPQWRNYLAAENAWFRMLRTDRFKYCAFADRESVEWLGDVKHDPGEMRNLVADPGFQDVLTEHRRLLAEWSDISGDAEASRFLLHGWP